MMACDHCQRQMLPFLYDLLDGPERYAVESHLRICVPCQQALVAAQEHQLLLAEAVKQEFPTVHFEKPTTSLAVSPDRQEFDAEQRARRRPIFLNRWVVAATLLLSLAGIYSLWLAYRISDNQLHLVSMRENVAKSLQEFEVARVRFEAEKVQIQNQLTSLNKQTDQLLADWENEFQRTRVGAEVGSPRLAVYGPRAFLAGAANRYQIEVQTPRNPRTPKVWSNPVVAKVWNVAEKKVVFEKTLPPAEKLQLDLPPTLAVSATTDLMLELETTSAMPNSAPIRERIHLTPTEYITHVATDRSVYKPGDTLRARSLTVDRFHLHPAREELALIYRLVGSRQNEVARVETSTQLLDESKKPFPGIDGKPMRGVAVAEMAIPKELPSGTYVLAVSEKGNRFPPEFHTVTIASRVPSRIWKKVTFDRSTYGPLDAVQMTLRAKPMREGDDGLEGGAVPIPMPAGIPGAVPGGEGGMPAGPINFAAPAMGAGMGGAPGGIEASVNVHLDGALIFSQVVGVTDNPPVNVSFQLPAQIARGEGSVTIDFRMGGITETVVRSLPVATRDLVVEFYPEGGELIAGVPNRVYFLARTPAGVPTAIRGKVIDLKNKRLTEIQSFSEPGEPRFQHGQGVFTIVPQLNQNYEVKLEQPLGLSKRFFLPRANAGGVVLSLPSPLVRNELPIEITSVERERELYVGTFCRGKLVYGTSISAKKGQKLAQKLPLPAGPGGVHRVTVFEKRENDTYVPIAERLTYRESSAELNLAIRPDRDHYYPAEKVRISLEAKNENRDSVPAYAMVCITDVGLGKTEVDPTARSLGAHFYLANELRKAEDLEHTDILLGSQPGAAISLDLMLGTQGWRRFAEQNPGKFARPRTPTFLAGSTFGRLQNEEEQRFAVSVDPKYHAKFVEIQKQLAAKEREERGENRIFTDYREAEQRYTMNVSAIQAIETSTEQCVGQFIQLLLGSFVIGGLFFGFFFLSFGLNRMGEGKWGVVWITLGFILLGILVMVSVVATFAMLADPHLWVRNARGWRGQMPARMAPVVKQAIIQDAQEPLPENPQMNEEVLPWVPQPGKSTWTPEQPDRVDPGFEEFDPQAPLPAPFGPPGMEGVFPGAAGGPMVGADMAGDGFPGLPNAGEPGRPRMTDAELRQQEMFDLIVRRHLKRPLQLSSAQIAGVVRQYAHVINPDLKGVAKDSTETVYWHPILTLPGGKQEISFDLSEAVTQYRVQVLGHTANGRFGMDTATISARQHFNIEPKVPVEISSSDTLQVPTQLRNEKDQKISGKLHVSLANLRTNNAVGEPFEIAGKGTLQRYLSVNPTIPEGTGRIRVSGKVEGQQGDAVDRTISIKPDGFLVGATYSGTLRGDQGATPLVLHDAILPQTWIPGTLKAEVRLFPSPLADLQQVMEGISREPGGNFEYLVSRNYVHVLALNYLRKNNQSHPALEQRSRQQLETGYQQLLTFECGKPGEGGFEWFGNQPPHEALTAYALMNLTEMSTVFPVDDALLTRTRQFLLSRRDGQGGFHASKKVARPVSSDLADAYITWAFAETGYAKEVSKELDALRNRTDAQSDPYYLALLCLAQLKEESGENETPKNLRSETRMLLENLKKFQAANGAFDDAKTSITGANGRDLHVETTALATLAWIRADRRQEFGPNIQRSIDWLIAQRTASGTFGAPQGTVLALKALIAHQRSFGRRDLRSEVQVQRTTGDMNIETFEVALQPNMRNPVIRSFDVATMKPGRNALQLSTAGDLGIPYSIVWSCRTNQPESSKDCVVHLATSIEKMTVKAGDTVKLRVEVENKEDVNHGMPVALIGIPGGLQIAKDSQQLKKLVQDFKATGKAGVLSAWEMQGRDLILRWREVGPKQKIILDLDLIAEFPGTFVGPPSRAYLTYQSDAKHTIEPLRVEIVGQKQ